MPAEVPVRYQSSDEDSARWLGFEFRPGDIVISTRSKSGTTWVQMICALLVFRTAELPAPLADLSPWLDWLVTPRDEVFAGLAEQSHRRIIKTHTPLDGIPLDPRATYIVVARDPLDMAVSLYHQGTNLDRARMRQLTGHADADPPHADPEPARPPLRAWLRAWVEWEGSPRERMDSLPGVLWHLSDAWSRRDRPNMVLVHYDDLLADLDGAMRDLARRLDLAGPDDTWSDLVEAARFEQMRARAAERVPDARGVLKDASRFFRRGSSGEGHEVLSGDEVAQYRSRVAGLVPPDLDQWLHRWGP
jgi:aryl sulfotransferase